MNRRQRRRDAKRKSPGRGSVDHLASAERHLGAGNMEGAAKALRKATETDQGNFAAWANLGAVEMELGRPEAAARAFERALALDGRSAAVLGNFANLRMQMGQRDDAEALYRRALAEAPDDGELYYDLSRIKRFRSGDPEIDEMTARLESGSMDAYGRMFLGFALAKAQEDAGDFDAAMRHLLAANRGKRAQVTFDMAAEEDFAARILAAFKPGMAASITGQDRAIDRRPKPIFVLGMPRSGTTLVEQILASHSQVHGAGEVNYLRDVVIGDGSPASGIPDGFPEGVAGLDGRRLDAIGRSYLKRLQAHAPEASHITDKMPRNFYFIGAIALALPGASIVHCRRSPMDTCVSCFAIHFPHGQDFSYDLEDLGRYYRSYAGLMEHWHRCFPGRILDLQYEDLVRDPEPHVRRLLDHCGLPWEDDCLDFDKTKRQITTASAAQVRQPVHTGSVARWRRFENHLGPLRAALGPLADADGGHG